MLGTGLLARAELRRQSNSSCARTTLYNPGWQEMLRAPGLGPFEGTGYCYEANQGSQLVSRLLHWPISGTVTSSCAVIVEADISMGAASRQKGTSPLGRSLYTLQPRALPGAANAGFGSAIGKARFAGGGRSDRMKCSVSEILRAKSRLHIKTALSRKNYGIEV